MVKPSTLPSAVRPGGLGRQQMTRHDEHVLTRVADARAEEVNRGSGGSG